MDEKLILAPVIQYGFAGMSGILLVIIVWLIRRLLDVLRENNKIIAENTAAIRDVHKTTGEALRLTRSVHEKMLSRPCTLNTKER